MINNPNRRSVAGKPLSTAETAHEKREKQKVFISEELRRGTNWLSFAECAKRDPYDFSERMLPTAKRICNEICLVKVQCFEDARKTGDVGPTVRAGLNGEMRAHKFRILNEQEQQQLDSLQQQSPPEEKSA